MSTTTVVSPSQEVLSSRDTSDNDNVLEAQGVTMRFGGLVAVNNVDFYIPRGAIVSIIGPNGAGKTTFFNVISGLYKPTSGRIVFDGRNLTESYSSPVARPLLYVSILTTLAGFLLSGVSTATVVVLGLLALLYVLLLVPGLALLAQRFQGAVTVAAILVVFVSLVLNGFNWQTLSAFIVAAAVYVYFVRSSVAPSDITKLGIARTFQNIRLFANMTALENVLVGQHSRLTASPLTSVLRTPSMMHEEERAAEKAHRMLQIVDLDWAADELAKNLPYGAQRRLEIARALASDPKLLLLDEPTAGMNPNETRDLINLIRQVRDDFKLSILLIEHDMKVVMGLSERITVLDYGTKIAEGTPAEVRANPRVIEAYLGRGATSE